jgi:LEA14-like dessication related protein
MMKFLALFLAFFLISSCEFYEDIDMVTMGKVRLDKLEGNNAVINIDVELDNPNFYAIKVKPSFLEVYVEDEYMGKAHLLEKVKIKRKRTGTYNVKLELQGQEGIVKKAMKYAQKDKLKVRLVGKVKGSVFFISKKIAVDETKTIDGGILRVDMPFFQ